MKQRAKVELKRDAKRVADPVCGRLKLLQRLTL